jgi:hypothetical protein
VRTDPKTIITTLSEWDKTLLVTSLRAAGEVFEKDASTARAADQNRLADQFVRQGEGAYRLADMLENCDSVTLTTEVGAEEKVG